MAYAPAGIAKSAGSRGAASSRSSACLADGKHRQFMAVSVARGPQDRLPGGKAYQGGSDRREDRDLAFRDIGMPGKTRVTVLASPVSGLNVTVDPIWTMSAETDLSATTRARSSSAKSSSDASGLRAAKEFARRRQTIIVGLRDPDVRLCAGFLYCLAFESSCSDARCSWHRTRLPT